MKKVVIFGGGTGISSILSGLKLFPIDVTAIIAVSDNGSSAGVLKEEFNIPAVGDVGNVLISMANIDKDSRELLGYRFTKEGTLQNHPIKNILLAALIDIKGNLTEATKYMCKILHINGTILPLTEEKVELVGVGENEQFLGEMNVTQNVKKIKKLMYDHDVKVRDEVIKKIKDADLIIFSSGSLYTSILPHLIVPEVRNAIKESNAPTMYISNLVTQPGETDGYTVSDHIKTINEYLDDRKVDIVIANNAVIDKAIVKKYESLEKKELVKIDEAKIKKMGARLIADKIFMISNGAIRHNALKTGFLVFSYLMEGE